MKKIMLFVLSLIFASQFFIPSVANSAELVSGEGKPAYFVAEFQLTDPEGIKPYSAKVESTFTPYSGRFIVRGGKMNVKEGFGAQGRLIIIKFDSLSQANAWYNSPEYQSIIPIRHRSGNTRTYIVEGLEGIN